MTYTIIHIVKFITLSILLCVAFFSFGIRSTHAYFTTNQNAIVIPGSHTGLFLIDYSFGTEKHEVLLPVKASNTTQKSTDAVAFSILDENGNVVLGKTTSIVLSSAALTAKGMYITPKNKATKFTLAVFFTPTSIDSNQKYRLQVTNLPFNFDGAQELQLNPSELKYYTTKLISL